MGAGSQQRQADLWLALLACEQLLRKAEAGEITPDEWTVEELEDLMSSLAARAVDESLAGPR